MNQGEQLSRSPFKLRKVTAWHCGTFYEMQGKSLLGLHKTYYGMDQRWGGIKVVWGGTHMVKWVDKEIKGSGFHVNVADQNACQAVPASFTTACPPLLTVFLDEGISFVYVHACMEV